MEIPLSFGKSKTIVALIVFGVFSWAQPSIVTSTQSITGGTLTPAVNTTGSNFLGACLTAYNQSTGALTIVDYLNGVATGNTWTILSEAGFGHVNEPVAIAYSVNPAVGPLHTFKITGVTVGGTIQVFAAANIDTSSPLDQSSAGAWNSGSTTIQPGPLTTSATQALAIACEADRVSTASQLIDSSFHILQQTGTNSGSNNAGALAYRVLALITPGVNPTWTTSSSDHSAVMSDFKWNGVTSPPACSALPTTTLFSGSYRYGGYAYGAVVGLDGSGSTGATSYLWSQLSGTSGSFSSTVSPTPTFTGPSAFGSVVLQLAATNAGGTTNCTIKLGFVPQDINGVVSMTTADPTNGAIYSKLVGELCAYGSACSVWPWYDDRNKTAADAAISNYGTTSSKKYYSYWKGAPNFAPGTVTLTGGSTTLAGNTTTMKTDLCSGGGSPRSGAVVMIRYTGTDSQTHYGPPVAVSGCASNTSITLASTYPLNAAIVADGWTYPNCDGGCGTLSFVYGWDGDTGYSAFDYSGNPWCYYDSCGVSQYKFYWRTGLDDYLTAAHSFEDEWWEHPVIDQGNTGPRANAAATSQTNNPWTNSGGFLGSAFRNESIMGLYIRARELGSGSSMWTGLRNISTYYRYFLKTLDPVGSPAFLYDIREEAYQLQGVATCAIVEFDATTKQACQDVLVGAVGTGNLFTKFLVTYAGQGPRWEEFYTASVTSIGGSATVSVTTGSTSVTFSAPQTWTQNYYGSYNQPFWVFSSTPSVIPPNVNFSDPTYYYLGCASPVGGVCTTSTGILDRAYARASCSPCTGQGFMLQPTTNYETWGLQAPFEGLLGEGYGLAALSLDGYDNTSRDLYWTYNANVAAFLTTYSYNSTDPTAPGGFYTFNAPVCPAGSWATDAMCGGVGVASWQSRSLPPIAMRAMGMAYQHSPDMTLRTLIDRYVSQGFSKPGTNGLTSDPNYITAWNDAGGGFPNGLFLDYTGLAAPKNMGESFGVGGGDTWAAYRVNVSLGKLILNGKSIFSGKSVIH